MTSQVNSPVSTSKGCEICDGRCKLSFLSLRSFYGVDRGHYCSECFEKKLFESMNNSGVPEKYLSCTFENFDAYNDALKRKLETVSNWCKEPLTRGLFLCGKVGTGKTHLAVAALRALLSRRLFYFEFLNVRRFIQKCQSSFHDDESLTEILEAALGCSFLVLDDLYSERPTDFALQILYAVVDHIYANRKRVIITSNAGLEKLSEFAPAVASRIVEMCDLVHFESPDYRVRLAQARAKGVSR
jgi:DNA replication protein DnaC